VVFGGVPFDRCLNEPRGEEPGVERGRVIADLFCDRLGVLRGSQNLRTIGTRTLVQWRRYVDGGRSGRMPTELSLPDLAPQLDRMVQHHNALAKQRLVDWLMRSAILAHKHPSGEPDPSDADVWLTRRMAEVGRMVGIPVVDHIIVARRSTVSTAALGLLEPLPE
jgi:proteasome lid subunit RPN8/RPN11